MECSNLTKKIDENKKKIKKMEQENFQNQQKFKEFDEKQQQQQLLKEEFAMLEVQKNNLSIQIDEIQLKIDRLEENDIIYLNAQKTTAQELFKKKENEIFKKQITIQELLNSLVSKCEEFKLLKQQSNNNKKK